MPHDDWPLFELRLVTEHLVLRMPGDADLPGLAALATEGIHDPASMPFDQEWTDQPSPQLERGLYQWNWRIRGTLSPAAWVLGFMVERRDDGEVLGVQDLLATDFPVRRTVETSSWLGRSHQRQGYGTEMRSAVLALAFEGLGAEWAETSAWSDNVASIGVTRALGYRDDGVSVGTRRGRVAQHLRFRLSRSEWFVATRTEVTIDGLAGAQRLLGLVEGDRGAPGAG